MKEGKDLVVLDNVSNMGPSEANPCKIWWYIDSGRPVPEFFGLPWKKWEDLGNDSYSVTFDVPDSNGEYEYVISCDVDGLNVTSTAASIGVEKEEKKSPGFGPVLGITALAIVASLAVGARRRR